MLLRVPCSISKLRKVCNHPSLTDVPADRLPADLLETTFEEQGSKLAVVSFLLHSLRKAGNEKIVLVSISTQVLGNTVSFSRGFFFLFD